MSEKASGLRQPSKIGRPCCAQPPKPAVPSPPPTLSSSMNSMEPIYENPNRKSGSAGLRRESDTSVILTEDTDSFIIGDRIWVGGTKPGSIAFIGETKFAPGEWAGVVLDEPIGKNDGSVAGTRYFQCASKHGIFSRLTRLTRYPLSDASLLSPNETKSPMSPEARFNKAISPSLNTSTTSLCSTVSHRDLKLGDRVIVSSSQGSKTGVLRYIGETEFAAGEWCGVELDDAVGKNDGSVADKRYFECRPKHGLFAPLHKVSRSPSSKRTSMCVVHKPSGAALNSSMRRMSSRESVASISSMASTTTSTATRGTSSTARKTGLRTSPPVRSSLQEMIKEKQQEIEMLKKERDLERERITKAANQADHAEQSIAILKNEYDKYREDMEKVVVEKQNALLILEEEKNQLNGLLEEERQKCEDLLFRFEEESVNKEDIQKDRTEQNVMNILNENKIKELESQLTAERERVIQLERENTKLFEVEEELEKIRSEKTEYLHLQNRNLCLEEAKITLEHEVLERNDLIDHHLSQIKELEAKISYCEQKSVASVGQEANLQKNYEDIKTNLEEKLLLVDKMKAEYSVNTQAMTQEIEKLNDTINKMIQQSTAEKELISIEHQRIIAEKDRIIQLKSKEVEEEAAKHMDAQKIALEQLTTENASQVNQLSTKLSEQLAEKNQQIESLTQKLNENSLEFEKLSEQLTSHKTLVHSNGEELKILNEKLHQSNAQLASAEISKEELKNEMEQTKLQNADEINLINDEKRKLEGSLLNLQTSISAYSTDLEKLKEDVKVKEMALVELQQSKAIEIEQLTRSFECKLEEKTQYITEMDKEKTQKSMKLNSLEQEVIDVKSQLTTTNEEVKLLLAKTSDLQDAITLSEQTKTNLESELRMYEVSIVESNQKISHAEEKIAQLIEQKTKLENEIANVISTSADSSDQLIKYNDELRSKEKQLDEFRERTFHLEELMTSSEAKMNRAEEELKAANQSIEHFKSESGKLKDQLDAEQQEKDKLVLEIHSLKMKEEELAQLMKSNEVLKAEVDTKIHMIDELMTKLKLSEENVSTLKEKCSLLSSSSEKQAQALQNHTGDLEHKLVASQEAIKNLQDYQNQLVIEKASTEKSVEVLNEQVKRAMESNVKLETLIVEKENEMKCLTSKMDELTKEKISALEATCNEKQRDEAEISKLTDNVSELQIQLKESEMIFQQNVGILEATVVEKNNVSSKLEETIVEITENIEQLQKENSEYKKKLEGTSEDQLLMEKKMKLMECDFNAVQSELAVKVKIIEELGNMVESLKIEQQQTVKELEISFETKMNEAKSALDNSIKEMNTIKSENQNLNMTVELLKGNLSEREKDIANLQREIEMMKKEKEEIMCERIEKNQASNAKETEFKNLLEQNKNLAMAKVSLEKNYLEAEEKIHHLSCTIKTNEEATLKTTQNYLEELNTMKMQSADWRDNQSQLETENKHLNTKLNKALDEVKTLMENKKNMTEINSGNQMIVLGTGNSKEILNNDMESRKMVEDNEMYKGQIDFLNSVIVDMQKKNEKLMCKIEVLEMGIPTNEVDDYNRSTLDNKASAPRMFCDICDEFDLHETEDCPKQSQDFELEKPPQKLPKTPAIERPYCETCEMFGHDTADCDDAETF